MHINHFKRRFLKNFNGIAFCSVIVTTCFEFYSSVISYETLLNIFWHNIDPFDDKGQFCDKGFAYTSVIFYNSEAQKTAAENSKRIFEDLFHHPIATQILPATLFVEAEEYHQNYKLKNPVRYNFYRWNCGRDKRLTEIWGEKTAHAK